MSTQPVDLQRWGHQWGHLGSPRARPPRCRRASRTAGARHTALQHPAWASPAHPAVGRRATARYLIAACCLLKPETAPCHRALACIRLSIPVTSRRQPASAHSKSFSKAASALHGVPSDQHSSAERLEAADRASYEALPVVRRLLLTMGPQQSASCCAPPPRHQRLPRRAGGRYRPACSRRGLCAALEAAASAAELCLHGRRLTRLGARDAPNIVVSTQVVCMLRSVCNACSTFGESMFPL